MARCLLFAAACIACCILYVCAEAPADQPMSAEALADQPMSAEDAYEAILAALFGYKPCLDENCGERPLFNPDDSMGDAPQDMGTDDSYLLEDNPRMHCILLRPSAVDTFAAVENMHSGISAIKYKVLEELIDHMYPFSTLKVEHCRPEMKLVDFVVLAANSVKTQYVLQGFNNCTYKSSKSIEQPLYPTSNKTEAICGKSTLSSEYGTEGSLPDCHGVTKALEVSTHSAPVTKSYPDGTTEKPCEGKTPEKPCAYEKQTEKPCELNVTKGQDYPESNTESPCRKTEKVKEPYSSTEEILAEDDSGYPPFVGSLKGIPGIHYPNYTDIPLTSFSCADKKYIPGFFADLETGCQVFHVCYEHRRESFLCPKGTTFNQPILACDFWYNYNCSLAYEDYAVNEKAEFLKDEKIDLEVKELVSEISEEAGIAEDAQNKSVHFDESVLEKITPFLPVKAVVTELEPAVEEIVKPVHKVEITPEPVEWKPVKPKKPFLKMEPMNMEELFAKTVLPLAKAKLAAIPVAKLAALKVAAPVAAKVALPIGKLAASKVKAAAVPVAAAKIAIPVAKVATKAKVAVPLAAAKVKTAAIVPAVAKVKAAAAVPVVAKAKLAVPVVAKSKIAAASIPVIAKGKVAAVTAPKVVAKASIPVLAAKKVASAVPLAKAKAAPALKAKLIKGGAPLFKAKALSLPLAKPTLIGAMPLMKAKLVKTAAISPLTKKALALGYMKLLKAKKIPLMG